MTRVPSGNFCSLNRSPEWTNSGGVRSSTSNTNPGLVTCAPLLVLSWIERHLERSHAAGAHRVVDRLAPASERVGRADHAVERRTRRRDVDRDLERVLLLPGARHALDPARV